MVWFYLLLLALFVAGTLLLAKTKQERHFIVFMVRTRYFIGLIDTLARFSPAFWKLIADLAIFMSFGGLGAFYLSKQGREGRNLDFLIFCAGALAALLWAGSLPVLLLLLAALAAGVYSLSKKKDAFLDFVVSTILVSAILLRVMDWYLAVPSGAFGLLAAIFGLLINNALDISSGASDTPGVSPLIPWIDETGELGFSIPGVGVFIPLIPGLLSLLMLLFVHEFSHGILARVHGLTLKSTGLLTVGPMPVGAFVEPDEEEMQKTKSVARMRVLAMGSFSNLMLSIAAILLFAFLIAPPDGLVVADSGIEFIENGSLVFGIEDLNFTQRSHNLSYGGHLQEAFNAMLYSHDATKVNGTALFENKTEINIMTDRGSYVIPTGDLSLLGLRYEPGYRYGVGFVEFNLSPFLLTLLFWLWFFNINIALANLLPLVPLDGGKMIVEIMSVFRLSEEEVKKIVYAFLLFGLVVLLLNAMPLFAMALSFVF